MYFYQTVFHYNSKDQPMNAKLIYKYFKINLPLVKMIIVNSVTFLFIKACQAHWYMYCT